MAVHEDTKGYFVTGGDYKVRRFRAALPEDNDYDQTRSWIQAKGAGFYDKRRSDEFVAKMAATINADGRELTGVYQTNPVQFGTQSGSMPVATFAPFRKTLNAGYGLLVPAHLITSVTVRTDHRRRGLLRRLMMDDLARAKHEGVSIAALTATEASIYRRFGFGAATAVRRITVTTGPRFRLAVGTDKRIESIQPAALLEVAPVIFSRVHRMTPGSIDRQEDYRLAAGGQWADDGGEDTCLRSALHFGPDGEPDGYVTYYVRGGNQEPYTAEIRDLVTAKPEAYLALWDFLGSLDLVERVTWHKAPVDDPLAWALEDPRVLQVGAVQDELWLRILDIPAALSARRYSADGELILEVADGLGIARGLYRLHVEGGNASVSIVDEAEADLSLDVADLGSIYVGGVRATTLKDAGRIAETNDKAALMADRMFAVERPAHCLTSF